MEGIFRNALQQMLNDLQERFDYGNQFEYIWFDLSVTKDINTERAVAQAHWEILVCTEGEIKKGWSSYKIGVQQNPKKN